MWKLGRLFGTLLIAAGVLTLAWVVCVWRWQDPFTAVYTHIEQSRLSSAYDRRAESFRPQLRRDGSLASLERQVAATARAYRATLHTGDPIGRIKIGRIGLSMVVVQGTDHRSLEKGPGHYAGSALPGEGRLIYVAGHRTTYLAPFRNIDKLHRGNHIILDMPYGTFTYTVEKTRVVTPDATWITHRVPGAPRLVLSACHPLYSASHRIVAFARLTSEAP
jgi:sortase A